MINAGVVGIGFMGMIHYLAYQRSSEIRAAAICSAFGMTSHPFMEPGVPFADRVAFIKPLWDAMGTMTHQRTSIRCIVGRPLEAGWCIHLEQYFTTRPSWKRFAGTSTASFSPQLRSWF